MSELTRLRDIISSAMDLIAPKTDPADPEYKPRVAIVTKLMHAYGEPAERVEHYVDVLWCEVPIWWLAYAVERLIAERVYPTVPTPGDIRRQARELAGMDRAAYGAGRYLDNPRRQWPPPWSRHAVPLGGVEALLADQPLLAIEAGSAGTHHQLPAGADDDF